jgi:hypothetical protein
MIQALAAPTSGKKTGKNSGNKRIFCFGKYPADEGEATSTLSRLFV